MYTCAVHVYMCTCIHVRTFNSTCSVFIVIKRLLQLHAIHVRDTHVGQSPHGTIAWSFSLSKRYLLNSEPPGNGIIVLDACLDLLRYTIYMVGGSLSEIKCTCSL